MGISVSNDIGHKYDSLNNHIVCNVDDLLQNKQTNTLDINNVKNIHEIFENCCEYGTVDKLNYLLNNSHKKLDVHFDDDQSYILACKNGHIDVIKILFSHDTICSYDNFYGICCACEYNHIDIVKYIIEMNPYIDIKASSGISKTYSPFIVSCEKNNLEIVQYLWENLDIGEDYITGYEYACIRDNYDVVKYLFNVLGDKLKKYDKKNHSNLYLYNCIKVSRFLCSETGKFMGDIDDDVIEWCEKNNIITTKNRKIIENRIECPICMDKMSTIVSNCNHQTCKICHHKMKYIHKCYMCRCDITCYFNIKIE
jgi:hypothetical protein